MARAPFFLCSVPKWSASLRAGNDVMSIGDFYVAASPASTELQKIESIGKLPEVLPVHHI
jgi:hypothetical protein